LPIFLNTNFDKKLSFLSFPILSRIAFINGEASLELYFLAKFNDSSITISNLFFAIIISEIPFNKIAFSI